MSLCTNLDQGGGGRTLTLDLHTITKHLDTKHSEVIDCALKIKIDKGIAHLTSNLDPDNVELKGLREELKSKNRILQALGDKFFSMIDDYA